jgi:hypothetical protein
MGTPYETIYDAFLSKIEEDNWGSDADQLMLELDWRSILEGAIPLFKFPKISLARDNDGFIYELGTDEIQILANLMKEEWLSRTIHSWENVRVMYDERDFSQANLVDKFTKLLSKTEERNKKLQKMYYRVDTDENGKRNSYRYRVLAGGEHLND